MGWQDHYHAALDVAAGRAFRRPVSRPLCLDRRFPGSHITCCLYAEHEGDHESEDGDRWRDDP